MAATPSAAAREATTGSVLQSLPIRFEPSGHNGDFDARGLGYRMSVSATGGQVDLGAGTSIGFRIQDGNAGASVRPEKKQPGVTTYFLGSERRTSVPGYGRVTYGDVLPGIDISYYGANGRIEFDFFVQPGADPSSIAVHYSGQKHLNLDAEGNLVIDLGGQQLTQKAPAVFQKLRDSSIRIVAAGYELRGDGLVGYQVGSYDHSLPLVIDPVLVYANYVGGTSADSVTRVVRDARGRLYVAGTTGSSDFVVTDNTLQLTPGGLSDAFLIILDPGTNQQLYSTFFGGSGVETVTGLGVDSAGRAYLTGVTASSDFPMSRFPVQGVLNGTSDAYFVVIDPSQGPEGLVYSTYLGGSADETPTDMAVQPWNGCNFGLHNVDGLPDERRVCSASVGGLSRRLRCSV